jgi:hypothetical protein
MSRQLFFLISKNVVFFNLKMKEVKRILSSRLGPIFTAGCGTYPEHEVDPEPAAAHFDL